jgi:hypothetical protein
LARIAQRIAVADLAHAESLVAEATEMASAIPNAWDRDRALASIAEQIVMMNPADPNVVDQALNRAISIRYDQARGKAVAAIARRIAATKPSDPTVIDRTAELVFSMPNDQSLRETLAMIAAIEPAGAGFLAARAVEIAATISNVGVRDDALNGIAQHLARHIAATKPSDPDVIDRAVKLATRITDDEPLSEALAIIAGTASDLTLWIRAAEWQTLSLGGVLRAASGYLEHLEPSTHRSSRISAGIALTRAIAEFAPREAVTPMDSLRGTARSMP